MKLNKQQARRVARQDADAAARLLRVQEAQIADLQQRLAAGWYCCGNTTILLTPVAWLVYILFRFMNGTAINMDNHPQQTLPGIPAEPKTPDFSHAAERRLFEEALRDVPFAPLYADLVAQGWYWRKAAVVAWLATPKAERQPQHQYELANLLGCSQELITSLKQRPEVQAQVMRISVAGLIEHKAAVDAALVKSASSPDYKANQDRKTFYTLIGALKEQHQLNVRTDDDAMSDMSTEELMALAAMGEDDDGADE